MFPHWELCILPWSDHAQLEYCSVVWSPHTSWLTSRNISKWSEFSEEQLSLFWRPWWLRTTEKNAEFVVLRTKAIFIWRIIPVLLSLNGYVDIDLSTYVQFFSDSDRYPLRGKDECTLKMKFARTNTFKFSFFNRIVDMWTHSTIACSSGNN